MYYAPLHRIPGKECICHWRPNMISLSFYFYFYTIVLLLPEVICNSLVRSEDLLGWSVQNPVHANYSMRLLTLSLTNSVMKIMWLPTFEVRIVLLKTEILPGRDPRARQNPGVRPDGTCYSILPCTVTKKFVILATLFWSHEESSLHNAYLEGIVK